MKNLAANLKSLLDKAKISESELARQTGIGQSVIHRLASGETINPKLKTLKPIIEYFSISVEQLLSDNFIPQDQPFEIAKNKNMSIKTLPLLTFEQVVPWLEKKLEPTNMLFITYDDKEFSENCYALQMQDSTLAPRFTEGTYFIADPNLTAKNRDFIVFCRGDSCKASIRQLFIDNDERYLKALNPDFRTIQMNQEYKFLGTIVQAQIGYKFLPGSE